LVNDSTVLLVSSEFAVYLWRRLIALGADFDLKIGGHLAEEAVRIGRGVPAFGREVSPAMLVGEIRASEGGDDRTDARIGVPRTHRGRVLAAFSSPMTVPGFGAHDVILEAGRAVGELTSRVLLPGWSTAWALGVLDRARWQGAGLTAVADGRLWPLDPRSTRWQAALRNHG
jgi:glycine cleavage system aminomethyltransferase T